MKICASMRAASWRKIGRMARSPLRFLERLLDADKLEVQAPQLRAGSSSVRLVRKRYQALAPLGRGAASRDRGDSSVRRCPQRPRLRLRRQAVRACLRAAPSRISNSSRLSFMPANCLSRPPQPFQLATAYRPFLGNPVGALGRRHRARRPVAASLTCTPGRASCQGCDERFSGRISHPSACRTDVCTGGSAARISASTASVGTPRSISQIRRALPYCATMRARKSLRVVSSAVIRPEHLVGERQPFRRHDQCNDHLHAVAAVVTRIPVPTLVAFRKRRIALEIGTGQVVEQDVERNVEQVAPTPDQMVE